MTSLGKILTRRGTRQAFRKDTSGATAVEFAMVMPLFFLVLGVILETGLMLFTEYVLQTSVQEAARVVRTGQAQEKKLTAATFKTQVCRIAKVIIACESKVTVYLKADANFTALSTSVPSYMSIGPGISGVANPMPFQCGTPNQAVALIATYDWNFTIPYFMSFFGNMNSKNTRRLAGFAMFKNEPFPVVAGNTCS